MSTHMMTTRSRAYKEFQFFCQLPPELRIMVWEHAIDLLGFTWYELEKEHLQKMITPLWSVNHESRDSAIRHSKVKPLGLHKIIFDHDYSAFRRSHWVDLSMEYSISQCFQFGDYAFFTVPRMCHGENCKRNSLAREWSPYQRNAVLISHECDEEEHQDAAYNLVQCSPIKEALQKGTLCRGLFFLDLDKFRCLTSQKCLTESAHRLAAKELRWDQILEAQADMIANTSGCTCMALAFFWDPNPNFEHGYSWGL